MGKLACPCGEILSDVAYPNDKVFSLISQVNLEAVWDCPKSVVRPLPTAFDGADGLRRVTELAFEHLAHNVWKCTKCKRIAIFHKEDKGLTWYKVDKIVS